MATLQHLIRQYYCYADLSEICESPVLRLPSNIAWSFIFFLRDIPYRSEYSVLDFNYHRAALFPWFELWRWNPHIQDPSPLLLVKLLIYCYFTKNI